MQPFACGRNTPWLPETWQVNNKVRQVAAQTLDVGADIMVTRVVRGVIEASCNLITL